MNAEQLEQFRAVQRLAYDCAEEVAAGLAEGVTEKQTAKTMRTWLLDHGVDDWFHLPFAWFGDRTAFRGFRTSLDFFPSHRRLEPGMPYILDVAPVVDGATADIGYGGSLGANPTFDLLHDDLAAHRELLLREVQARRSFRDIYDSLDALIARQGHENRHRRYPFGVVAHQVFPLRGGRVPKPVLGFGPRSTITLFRTMAVARRQGWSPLWGGTKHSDHRPVPGLWAVEPHLGQRGVGTKFEELLVVTEDDAFWLDDDLPHVRRWAQRGVLAGARS